MASQKQCSCGKVCGNGGALARHRKSKMCPLNKVAAQVPAQVPADDLKLLQIRNIEIEHDMKMRALAEDLEKSKCARVAESKKVDTDAMTHAAEMEKLNEETRKAQEETRKAKELRVLETTRIKLDIEQDARVCDAKIVRIGRTTDAYVDHVHKMTQLAEEDAHQWRLLTLCPHMLNRDEFRVYGTAYNPCVDKNDMERYVDTHLALEGAAVGDVKAIMNKMTLQQDNVRVDETSPPVSMRLISLRDLSRVNRITELDDDADAADAADDVDDVDAVDAVDAVDDVDDAVEGNRMVLSFEQRAELTRSINAFGSRPASDVDDACITSFFGDLAVAVIKAQASVTRHRVHIPSALQDMVDEQCSLKARKTSHNRFEFWSRMTGDACEHPCATCGCALTRNTFEMGHRVAKARGGSYDLKNMMVQCGPCNINQGVLHPDLFKSSNI